MTGYASVPWDGGAPWEVRFAALARAGWPPISIPDPTPTVHDAPTVHTLTPVEARQQRLDTTAMWQSLAEYAATLPDPPRPRRQLKRDGQ